MHEEHCAMPPTEVALADGGATCVVVKISDVGRKRGRELFCESTKSSDGVQAAWQCNVDETAACGTVKRDTKLC